MTNKVLIVDDEPDVLASTAMLVEALGYEPVTVGDPAKILEVVEREMPGVILQDLKMPGLNVAGLVAALRLNPPTAEIPLVFFSAGGDLAQTAARYDAWGYLAKPFGKEGLAQTLAHAMGPPSAPPKSAKGSDLKRDVRAIFHDYWNLLAALSNYVLILDETENLGVAAQRSVKGLDELVLKLESKTDRLRDYVIGVLGSLEPSSADHQDAPEPRTG
ncbi:MAG: response regulator [Thermoplasmatota archaeon]